MKQIWLIGGTRESAIIAQEMAAASLPTIVTATTATAQSLYPNHPQLKVEIGQLDCLQLEQFLEREEIIGIVDASHPYAVQISQIAMEVALKRNLPYLRYERPYLNSVSPSTTVIELDSFDTLLESDYLLGERVLLTVGYKMLPRFQVWQNRATLFARILPDLNSLEIALAAGFTAERIIAFRPPFSAELEKALWQDWHISLVVTKASGEAGGEDIKRRVAAELGIPLIIIARPKIIYPQQTSNLLEVLSFCRQDFGVESLFI
jgi:precorrin-6A/cobalt-precorrin-6A reductase